MAGTYDRIARFYDVDMGQSMRFDDVAFYAHRCARERGSVLELGCGNGRILLPLLAQGLDAYGVDASAPMLAELARKARAKALPLRAARADARRLPLRPGFAAILCPYSLVTYMTARADLTALLAGARSLLAPRGVLVVDAFVPQPVVATGEFSPDYRRPFGALMLARSKRIAPQVDGTNRIERRYELIASGGRVVETIEAAETIRPYSPAELRDAVAGAGLAVVDEAWDYGTRPAGGGAQFFTLVARKRGDD
ncbi:MAG TPA: class I SAM-dependent methyltransferase [Casimicrobiaceae bacterium]|nr:class I SAM-dependent methyltransferase [Casimicrobiaceae bacterium]